MKNNTNHTKLAIKQMAKSIKCKEQEAEAKKYEEDDNVCCENINKKIETKKNRGKNPDFINDWNKR